MGLSKARLIGEIKMYDYPDPSTISSGFLQIFYYLNYVSSGWFANMTLIGLYILILYGYYKATDEFAAGLAIAGFVTFVVSLLFWLGSFISGITFTIVIAMAIIGFVVLLVVAN